MSDTFNTDPVMMSSQSYAEPAHGTGSNTCVDEHVPVRVDPCPDISLSDVGPHLQQQIILPEMLDPFSFRFEFSCQQPHLMYSDFLMETEPCQYQILTGTAPPGPPSCSQLSSASWFTDESVRSGGMADLHKLDALGHQQFQEGPPEATHTVVHDGTEGGQVVLVGPCEPGPMFHCVGSLQDHQNTGTLRNDLCVLESPSQFPQYQHTSLDECVDLSAFNQPPVSSERSVKTLCKLKSRKPCHCTKSQCLKLYCECFANGVMCSNCDCSNCHNNTKHEMKRCEAIKSCLDRNPKAFRPKIAAGRLGVAKGRHNKGCHCKRSGCLKNYCECYEASIMCTSSCKCVGCWNSDCASKIRAEKTTGQVNERRPDSVLTGDVLDAVCSCLLAQAEEAEKEARTPAMAQHMILQEFGCCLSEIVKALFK